MWGKRVSGRGRVGRGWGRGGGVGVGGDKEGGVRTKG